jgi:hypothetical protein
MGEGDYIVREVRPHNEEPNLGMFLLKLPTSFLDFIKINATKDYLVAVVRGSRKSRLNLAQGRQIPR